MIKQAIQNNIYKFFNKTNGVMVKRRVQKSDDKHLGRERVHC